MCSVTNDVPISDGAALLSAGFNTLSMPEEKQNVAMLSLVKYNDFSLAEQLTFGKSDRFIKCYVYQPLAEGAKPRDVEKWERIILKSCMREIRQNFESFWKEGAGGSDEQLLLPMWLAKYGKSDATKQFLIHAPFERFGILYMCGKQPWSTEFKQMTGYTCDDWLSWYRDYVIQPAGLEEDFKREMISRGNYIRALYEAFE